jgi:hypothetical protein
VLADVEGVFFYAAHDEGRVGAGAQAGVDALHGELGYDDHVARLVFCRVEHGVFSLRCGLNGFAQGVGD